MSTEESSESPVSSYLKFKRKLERAAAVTAQDLVLLNKMYLVDVAPRLMKGRGAHRQFIELDDLLKKLPRAEIGVLLTKLDADLSALIAGKYRT